MNCYSRITAHKPALRKGHRSTIGNRYGFHRTERIGITEGMIPVMHGEDDPLHGALTSVGFSSSLPLLKTENAEELRGFHGGKN